MKVTGDTYIFHCKTILGFLNNLLFISPPVFNNIFLHTNSLFEMDNPKDSWNIIKVKRLYMNPGNQHQGLSDSHITLNLEEALKTDLKLKYSFKDMESSIYFVTMDLKAANIIFSTHKEASITIFYRFYILGANMSPLDYKHKNNVMVLLCTVW